MSRHGFLEIETPILANPTPEGARDYLVPSRIYKGRFYALPQSPQQFKQTLMVSGFDRYFQIVRCFRDEDLAGRPPARVHPDRHRDELHRPRGFLRPERGPHGGPLRPHRARSSTRPFPRLTYAEAMEKYGSDKPDLRVPLEMRDLTAVGARDCPRRCSKPSSPAGGEVKGLLVPGAATLSRGQLDKLGDGPRRSAPRAWSGSRSRTAGSRRSSWPRRDYEKIWAALGGGDADLALLVADKRATALKALGEIRRTWPERRGRRVTGPVPSNSAG